MVFFHYCVVSNYFWLFIEGLYLFTLLVETFFPERRYFYWYTMVGWGRSGCGLGARYVLGAHGGASDKKRNFPVPSPLAPMPHTCCLHSFLLFLPPESPPLRGHTL